MDSDFRHQCCIYGSDGEFVAMAVSFARDGLRQGEPVLVTTTAANLDRLHGALGADAGKIDYAEPADFGRRPQQRANALRRYWSHRRQATSTGVVRILAEADWTGRSSRDAVAWKRMEAGLNVLLADTGIWLVCPYDTRIVDAALVADARRTHPECVVGRKAEPSAQFMTPEEVTGAGPAPQAPGDADIFRFEGDLVAVRRYVLGKAAPLLPEDSVAMFGVAVGEALTYLLKHGIDRAAVWVRPAAGRVVCTLRSDQPLPADPSADLQPPSPSRPSSGLWMTDQICEWLDISSDASGCTVELAMPGLAAEAARDDVESEGLGFGA